MLKINDYTPPAPDEGGVVIGRQKIWSENTKRNANCKLLLSVTNVGYYTLKITVKIGKETVIQKTRIKVRE